MRIVKANQQHITGVSGLFNLYRQFYQCESDLPLATRFISDRLANQESDIFIAHDNEVMVGFVQLYPSFCSLEAHRIYILYDLYVDEKHRKAGTGTRLMEAAHKWAAENEAVRVDLLTAHSNHAAQHLYEKLGYRKVLGDFYAYSLTL